MDIKDLILIGGAFVIAVVVAHGIWVSWRARRKDLQIKIDDKLIASVGERDHAEVDFPRGGARVVSRWDEPTVSPDAAPASDLATGLQRSGHPEAGAKRAPDAEALQSTRQDGRVGQYGPMAAGGDASERDSDWDAPAGETVAEAAVREAAAEQGGLRARREDPPRAGAGIRPPADAAASRTDEGLRAGVARRAQQALRAIGGRQPSAPAPGQSRSGAAAQGERPATEAPPEDLILINVLAPPEQPFTGVALVEAFRANGLRYGEMNIFHRVDEASRIHQFSVANIIEPGTFDLAEIDEFRTPGLCFFMRLPGPENPVEAFEDMQQVARDVSGRLGGELKDERRSVLTGQTVEHYRHRVAEFCRRRMSVRA